MTIRLLVWIIGLLILYNIFIKFRKKEITFAWFSFWFLLWAGIIGLVSHAYIADRIASFIGLGTGRGVELALFLAILIVLYLMFRLYLKINQIESQISEIVKHIALLPAPKKRRKNLSTGLPRVKSRGSRRRRKK